MTRDDLLTWLEANGFSQSSFAEEIGVTPGPISRWGKGTPIPLYAVKFIEMHDRLTEAQNSRDAALLVIRHLQSKTPEHPHA